MVALRQIGAPVARSQLTVFGTQGHRTAHLPAEVPENPDPALLGRLYQKAIKGKDCRYAVVRTERRVRALYLAEDLVPEKAVRLGTDARKSGSWATTSLKLGDWGGGRVFLGPQLFFRQVDILPREAWLSAVLLGFGPAKSDAITALSAEGSKRELLSFEFGGSRFYYDRSSSRWKLFGAGNTPAERIEAVRAEAGDDVDAFLWGIGAMPLQAPAQ